MLPNTLDWESRPLTLMTVRGYRMKMNYVDRHGRRTRPSSWIDVPAATRHVNGIGHIERYVARVLDSKTSSSWVHFSTKSGHTSISVTKRDGRLSLGLTVDVKRLRSREAAIREFFARRRIVPSIDYLAGNGGVSEATRVLGFPMPHDAVGVAEIASDLLRGIYRLNETTTLDIRFGEQ